MLKRVVSKQRRLQVVREGRAIAGAFTVFYMEHEKLNRIQRGLIAHVHVLKCEVSFKAGNIIIANFNTDQF